MNKLENLPEVTDRALNGLKADEVLRLRIMKAALQEKKQSSGFISFRVVPVLLSSVALMILCVFLLNGKKPLLPEEEQHLIHSFSAGDSSFSDVSFDLFAGTESASVEYMSLLSEGKISDRDQVNQLLGLLKEQSEPVSEIDIIMNDRLEIFGKSGLLYSLPAESPYIEWSDGIRRCDSFFALFSRPED